MVISNPTLRGVSLITERVYPTRNSPNRFGVKVWVSLRAAVCEKDSWFPPPLVPSPGNAMLVYGLVRGEV